MKYFLFLVIVFLGLYLPAGAQVTGSDILWSANTYVPEGYQGKALASPRSLVYAALFPTPSASYTYEWRVDGTLRRTYSGQGQSSMWFTTNASADYVHRVEVRVLNSGGDILEAKSVLVPVFDPKVVVYKNYPLSGTFLSRAVFGLLVGSEGQELRAVPYYFSKEDFDSLRYSWLSLARPLKRAFSPIFEISSSLNLADRVDVLIENTNTLFQSAKTSFETNVQ